MKSSMKLLLALLAIATACGPADGTVSENEKADRRNEALEVAGSYLEDSAGGSPARLEIKDERGRYDIVAALDNPRGLADEDRAALAAALRKDDATLTDAAVDEAVARIAGTLVSVQLGQGETFAVRGGENVVLDGVGDVGELALRKEMGSIHRDERNDYAVTVSFFATAYRDGGRLDFRTTAATDSFGKSGVGTKGLFLTVTNMARDAGGMARTRNVVRELPLRVGAFMKY